MLLGYCCQVTVARLLLLGNFSPTCADTHVVTKYGAACFNQSAKVQQEEDYLSDLSVSQYATTVCVISQE